MKYTAAGWEFDRPLYPLADVATALGWSCDQLTRDARAGRFEAVHRDRRWWMTPEQIGGLIKAHTHRPKPRPVADPDARDAQRAARRRSRAA
jgi:hypothetical protein